MADMKIPQWKWVKWVVALTILHAVLSAAAVLLAISTGLGPPDAGDPPPTRQQEIASAIGRETARALLFPADTLCNVFPQIRHVPWSDWPLVLFSGFFYAVVLVTLWNRLIRHGRKT